LALDGLLSPWSDLVRNHVLALPWNVTRDLEVGKAILNRIGELPEGDEGPKVTMESFRAVLDWGVLRVFYRLAVGASGEGSAIQYGYYRHVLTGCEEVVVGAWDLREAHVVMDELLASWSGPNLLQRSISEILGKIATQPGATIVDGAVSSPGHLVTRDALQRQG
jgi:hypothetical protein